MTRASAWIAPATTLRVNDREYDLVLDARTATADDRPADALLDREHDERGLDRLVLGVLRSALEQRVTREARDRGRFPAHLVS